jgi:phosphatidylserine decarboxylase
MCLAIGGASWLISIGVIFCFFRDPSPKVPAIPDILVSPAHGRIDFIEEHAAEPEFLGNIPCSRISIFLSVLDVHTQNAPISGKVAYVKHHKGQFLNALRTDSAKYNENALIGIVSSSGEVIVLRQIAGTIARRVVTWCQVGDTVACGDRIGLIQFGSRCDVYIPAGWRLAVKIGDKLRGGESILALRQHAPSSASV